MCQGPNDANAGIEKNIAPVLQALCMCGVTYSYVARIAFSPAESCPKRGPGSARLICTFTKQRCLAHLVASHDISLLCTAS